jgi:K+/H+ antiporter YhaU regulatory subunit KhtT
MEQLRSEMDAQARHFDSQLVDLRLLQAKIQQLQSEISTLTVSKRATELRLRAVEERNQLEKKTIQAQAASQVAAITIDCSQRCEQQRAQADRAFRELSGIFPNGHPSDIVSAVRVVVDEIVNLRTARESLRELTEERQELQTVLGLTDPSPPLSTAIQTLLEENAAIGRRFTEIEQQARQLKQDRERLQWDAQRLGEQIADLRLWENWGQRINRVLHHSISCELHGKHLRFVLEEALLSSISRQTVMFRTQSLREQKHIWTHFDRRLLTTKQPFRGTLTPIMGVCIFIRRAQRIAGHLPLILPDQASSTSEILSLSLPPRRVSRLRSNHSMIS